MPPGMARIVTLRGSNYRCLEQIFMVSKGFEPSYIWMPQFDLNEQNILSESTQEATQQTD